MKAPLKQPQPPLGDLIRTAVPAVTVAAFLECSSLLFKSVLTISHCC